MQAIVEYGKTADVNGKDPGQLLKPVFNPLLAMRILRAAQEARLTHREIQW